MLYSSFNSLYLSLLFLLNYGLMSAQVSDGNLVSNHSFESFYEKGGFIYCNDWSFLNSVDYFSSEYKGNDDIWQSSSTAPRNREGFQIPQMGKSYAGFVYTHAKFSFREFLSTKFSEKLKPGEKYLIEFYVSLSDSSKSIANSIAFNVSSDLKYTIKYNLESVHFENPIILHLRIGKDNWTKVSYTYVANGGEQYLTIGNCIDCMSKSSFYDIIDKKNIPPKHSKEFDSYGAYYYLDNVSVRPLKLIQKDKIKDNEDCEMNIFYFDAPEVKDTLLSPR